MLVVFWKVNDRSIKPLTCMEWNHFMFQTRMTNSNCAVKNLVQKDEHIYTVPLTMFKIDWSYQLSTF